MKGGAKSMKWCDVIAEALVGCIGILFGGILVTMTLLGTENAWFPIAIVGCQTAGLLYYYVAHIARRIKKEKA